MGYAKVRNHPQPPNYPQAPTTIHNHLKNHPQPSTTTQKLLKKAKAYSTLDVHTDENVWYWYETMVYIHVCVCEYI